MEGEPLVSVIVPVWNEARRVGLCLDALAVQTLGRDRYEVIVVDNGSTDGTGDVLAARDGIAHLTEPRAGSYAARNLGLAHARGRWIAFTDGDCIPDPDWLDRALAAAQADPDAGVIAGRIRLFEPEEEGSRACADWEQLFAFDVADTVRRGAAVTANWLSPRSAIDAAGGFDADARSGGDYKLARAIAATGRRIVYAPDAVVAHPVRARLEEHVAKTRRIVGGRWSTERRRPKAVWVMGLGAKDLVVCVVRALGARHLSLARRLGVVRVSAILFWVWEAEALRLVLGGERRR